MKIHVVIISIFVAIFLSACSANVSQTSKFDPEHANHHFSFHQEGSDYSRGSFYYFKDFLLIEVQSVIIHSDSKTARNYNQENCISVATIMNQLERNSYYLLDIKNVNHIAKNIATKSVIIHVGKTPYVGGGTFTTDEQSMYITNRNFIESGAVQVELRISDRNLIKEIEGAISKI